MIYEHLCSPRMVAENKQEKKYKQTKQTNKHVH